MEHSHAPKNTYILAECVPTWLAVADGWETELVEIFMAQPEKGQWFIDGLGVKSKVSILPTVVGVRGVVWRTSSDSVLLLQGSAKFVRKMVTGLSTIGITSNSHKIIIASSQKNRNLDLQFKFQRLAHDVLGGVTNDTGYIGFSHAIDLQRDKPTDVGVRRKLRGIMNVTESGEAIDDPHLPDAIRNKDLKLPSQYHSQLDLYMDEFEAPSVFSLSGWVQRYVTGEEFLASMDLPSSSMKWAKNSGVLKKGHHGGLLGSHPLKMVYGSFKLENTPAPTSSPTGAPEYILHSQIPGLEEIYDEINQSTVAKNDEAGVDKGIWNEAICQRPSDWKTDWLIVGSEYG